MCVCVVRCVCACECVGFCVDVLDTSASISPSLCLQIRQELRERKAMYESVQQQQRRLFQERRTRRAMAEGDSEIDVDLLPANLREPFNMVGAFTIADGEGWAVWFFSDSMLSMSHAVLRCVRNDS
jgi:hypothetical protein